MTGKCNHPTKQQRRMSPPGRFGPGCTAPGTAAGAVNREVHGARLHRPVWNVLSLSTKAPNPQTFTMQSVAARSFTGTALRAAVPASGKVRRPGKTLLGAGGPLPYMGGRKRRVGPGLGPGRMGWSPHEQAT